MRCLAAILLIFISTGSARPSAAAIRIADDNGGALGDYILRYSKIGQSGDRVIIDGRCYSACTAVLGLVPHERICVTPNAVFGFHAALVRNDWGMRVVDDDATRLLFFMYPKRIQDWINSKGGLNKEMIFLQGAELDAFYPRCR